MMIPWIPPKAVGPWIAAGDFQPVSRLNASLFRGIPTYKPDANLADVFIHIDPEQRQYDLWRVSFYEAVPGGGLESTEGANVELHFMYFENELTFQDSVEQQWEDIQLPMTSTTLKIYRGTGTRRISISARFMVQGTKGSTAASLREEVQKKVNWMQALMYPVADASGELLPPPLVLFKMGELFAKRAMRGYIEQVQVRWEGPYDYTITPTPRDDCNSNNGTFLAYTAVVDFQFVHYPHGANASSVAGADQNRMKMLSPDAVRVTHNEYF